MIKIKEKRMQSYVLRARKMVQEGKNKEGAENNTTKPELQETIKVKKPNMR